MRIPDDRDDDEVEEEVDDDETREEEFLEVHPRKGIQEIRIPEVPDLFRCCCCETESFCCFPFLLRILWKKVISSFFFWLLSSIDLLLPASAFELQDDEPKTFVVVAVHFLFLLPAVASVIVSSVVPD